MCAKNYGSGAATAPNGRRGRSCGPLMKSEKMKSEKSGKREKPGRRLAGFDRSAARSQKVLGKLRGRQRTGLRLFTGAIQVSPAVFDSGARLFYDDGRRRGSDSRGRL